MQVPTIKVHEPASDCGWKIINASDFDKELHTVYEEPKAESPVIEELKAEDVKKQAQAQAAKPKK